MASVDMKLKELLGIPEAVEILERHIPGMTTNRQLKMAMSMTFRSMSKFPQANIPDELLEQIDTELQAL